jgi:hypothetical protein
MRFSSTFKKAKNGQTATMILVSLIHWKAYVALLQKKNIRVQGTVSLRLHPKNCFFEELRN